MLVHIESILLVSVVLIMLLVLVSAFLDIGVELHLLASVVLLDLREELLVLVGRLGLEGLHVRVLGLLERLLSDVQGGLKHHWLLQNRLRQSSLKLVGWPELGRLGIPHRLLLKGRVQVRVEHPSSVHHLLVMVGLHLVAVDYFLVSGSLVISLLPF